MQIRPLARAHKHLSHPYWNPSGSNMVQNDISTLRRTPLCLILNSNEGQQEPNPTTPALQLGIGTPFRLDGGIWR